MGNPAGNAYSSAVTPAAAAEKEQPPTPTPSVTPTIETETAKMTLEARREALLEVGGPGTRKLTFREQCGAFAALYAGVRNQVVARAFGVSLQCASKISGCLEYDPNPYREEEGVEGKILMDHNRNRSPARHRHYETVAREFEALGREEFDRRYYTERVVNRLAVAKAQLREERALARKSDARAARGLGGGQ